MASFVNYNVQKLITSENKKKVKNTKIVIRPGQEKI